MMNCFEARRLLDAGVTPGAGELLRSRLGFHLSACPACRAYQQRHNALLAALLDEPLASSPVRLAASGYRSRPGARLLAPGLALSLLLVLAWLLAPAVMALVTIRGNLAAMRSSSLGSPTQVIMEATSTVVISLPTEPAPDQLPTVAAMPTHTVPAATTVVPPAARPFATAALAQVEYDASPLPSPPLASDQGSPILQLPTIVAAPRSMVVPTANPGRPLPEPARRSPPLVPQVAGPGAITILLLGIDRRPSEGGPARSDAIAVAYLEPARGRLAMLSLPRDLVVPIPGVGPARINSAAIYGELYPQLGGGRELARRTVEALLGLPIDYVIEADFMGFIAAIDAIGGVTVHVEQALYDAAYPTMDYGYQVVSFAPGPQVMDGATALIYSRIRHADSDFERMKRQQAVILAALERVRGRNLLQQLQSVADLTTALRDFVRTDLPDEQIISLAWALRDLDPAMVERYTLERSQVVSGVVADDPYALFALPGTIEGLVQELVGP